MSWAGVDTAASGARRGRAGRSSGALASWDLCSGRRRGPVRDDVEELIASDIGSETHGLRAGGGALVAERCRRVGVTGGDDLGDVGVVVFIIGDGEVGLDLYRRVSVTPSTALHLINGHHSPGFVVGDIIRSDAAEVLIGHGRP